MNRTIVIGDLHGCYYEALDLFDKVGLNPDDRVIFAGDLVDRGPYPRECVELAMQYDCILGNHEEKHLQQQYRAAEKLSPDHLRTRNALGPEHYDYFRKLPLYIWLPEYNAVVIHAGLYPGVPIEKQPTHLLLHGQCLLVEHTPPENLAQVHSSWPSKAPAGYTFWTNHWQGPERAIFGHTVVDRPLVMPYAVGIDTGAVFGRGLTALVLPGWELVSVPSRKVYHERNSSRGERPIRLYPLMDGVSAFS